MFQAGVYGCPEAKIAALGGFQAVDILQFIAEGARPVKGNLGIA
jgi:hypothetical protein